MSARLSAAFSKGHPALVTFITAGDGDTAANLDALVEGGSNAIGLFHPFLDDPEVAMIGVEAAGHGIETGRHAASLTGGAPGDKKTYLLEGIIPVLDSAHALAALPKVAKDYRKDQRILVNVSGRGDKDIFVAEHLGVEL